MDRRPRSPGRIVQSHHDVSVWPGQRPTRVQCTCARHSPIQVRGDSGKVDLRSERWREHRKKVRSEIVDAAFRAIDNLGPDVSIREIAEEAGTAKPKIYRHFNDKSDLFQAIGKRLRDMLLTAIFPQSRLHQRSHPGSHSPEVWRVRQPGRSTSNVPALHASGTLPGAVRRDRECSERGAEITMTMAEMFNNELPGHGAQPAALELAASATFGSGSLGDRLVVGPGPDSPRRMPSDEFVAHLTTLMLERRPGHRRSAWRGTESRTNRSAMPRPVEVTV